MSFLLKRAQAVAPRRAGMFRIPVRGMAADAKTLRTRMKVVATIQKITKAMKMVSAAKLNGLQRSLAVARDFQGPISDVWKSNEITGPYNSRAVVLITSDKGLCGSLNTALSRKAKTMLNEANNLKKSNPPYTIFALGTKGKFSLDRHYGKYFASAVTDYSKLKVLPFKLVAQVADRLLSENIEQYHFLFNRFKNLMVSEQKEEKLYNYKLALAAAGPLKSKYDIESGGYSDVIRDLYEFRFAVRLWHMFNENMTAEMSSRMNAMSNATKAASEMLNALTLQYNRTRQAKITTELIEIVSGAAALEQGRD